MKTIKNATPEMNQEFLRVLNLMCQPCKPFIRNQPKTTDEIYEMVGSLTEFCQEAESYEDIEIAQAQILVLIGIASVSNYKNRQLDILKAVKTAEKWLKGKAYDDDLFA